MRNNHHVSFNTGLLSLALLAGIGSAALAQDGADAASEPGPTPTIPGNRDSAIEEAVQNDPNENCRDSEPSLAAPRENDSASAAGSPDTLGTDARIAANRVNCLDEHNDAPHEDNLRFGNPNIEAPSDRTDIIIDEDQRNSPNRD